MSEYDQRLEKLAFLDVPGLDLTDIHERREDMSPDGVLRVLFEQDGDAIVSVIPGSDEDSRMGRAEVQFCSCGAGGGRSARVRLALRILAAAIYLDNQDRPI